MGPLHPDAAAVLKLPVGRWFSPSLALAAGMLLGHPLPRVPQAFRLRVTWLWVALVCSWLAFLGKDRPWHTPLWRPRCPRLHPLPQPRGDPTALPHHWQGSGHPSPILGGSGHPSPDPVGIPSPSLAGICSPFPSPGGDLVTLPHHQ